ncbi:MAG: cobyrinate a,c-diamide synthase [Eubacteriales bacterium]
MSKQFVKMNRVLIAGTHSGCGKTTVTCGILRALQKRGMDVRAFKCGPDYIDPMFHSEVLGAKSRNIDMFLCSKETAKRLFINHGTKLANCTISNRTISNYTFSNQAISNQTISNCMISKTSTSEFSDGVDTPAEPFSLVEGVMGYYDGLGGNTVINSTYHISEELEIPTILVVDCKGASISVVAMIQGYQNYRENRIVGVILNQVSQMMLPFYREMIEKETGLEVLGCMPRDPKATIGSRHLGLITAEEIRDLNGKIDLLGELVEENIDLNRLLEIGKGASELSCIEDDKAGNIEDDKAEDIGKKNRVRLAVARDKAFCFYYEDGLTTLEELGAELIYFSPLEDKTLPEGIHGIILGGGYPELYLEKLSGNQSMLDSIRGANESQMPIYAECGGFMYLGKSIDGYSMTGIIDMRSEMTTRLQNFGYASLTPLVEGTLMGEGTKVHEFHYSKSDMATSTYEATKRTGKTWQTGYQSDHVYAQYPHLHFSGEVKVAEGFLEKCRAYRK